MKSTIAQQNDQFRKLVFYRPQPNGKLVFTQGIASLPEDSVKTIFRAVASQTKFNEGNDPHKEHDFGSVEIPNTQKVFWKIDYYDSKACEYGAENPASPTTYRLMTLMLADEY